MESGPAQTRKSHCRVVAQAVWRRPFMSSTAAPARSQAEWPPVLGTERNGYITRPTGWLHGIKLPRKTGGA